VTEFAFFLGGIGENSKRGYKSNREQTSIRVQRSIGKGIDNQEVVRSCYCASSKQTASHEQVSMVLDRGLSTSVLILTF
jgi:hypothetical protein